MRFNRADYAKLLAVQQELARAEEDYQRLRAAYLEIARNEPGHDVALAMIGADMDRAHMALQSRIGLPAVPAGNEAAEPEREREREESA